MSLLESLVREPTKPESPPPVERIDNGDGNWVDVIPYNAHQDPNSRQFLPWLWKRLYDDGLVQLYFPDKADYSFPTFAAMMSSSSTQVLLVVIKTPPTEALPHGEVVDCIGFATWQPMQFGLSTVGHAGFIFLRDFWDRRTTLAAGHRIEKFWFEEMPQKLDIAVGIVATANVLAQRFLKRLGWTLSGTIPGIQEYSGVQSDGALWYITREQYEGRK